MVPPNSRLLHTIIWCYFFLMSTVHSFQYELYRRLNDTSQVWTGENGGSVIFTNCTTNAACGSNALCSERSCVCNATYYTLSSTQASGDLITTSQKGICGYQQLSKVFMIVSPVSSIFGCQIFSTKCKFDFGGYHTFGNSAGIFTLKVYSAPCHMDSSVGLTFSTVQLLWRE